MLNVKKLLNKITDSLEGYAILDIELVYASISSLAVGASYTVAVPFSHNEKATNYLIVPKSTGFLTTTITNENAWLDNSDASARALVDVYNFSNGTHSGTASIVVFTLRKI